MVVDNGSSDGTADIARQHGARVIDEPRPGVAARAMPGIRAAKGQIVAFIDADCVADAAWLRELLAGVGRRANRLFRRRHPPAESGRAVFRFLPRPSSDLPGTVALLQPSGRRGREHRVSKGRVRLDWHVRRDVCCRRGRRSLLADGEVGLLSHPLSAPREGVSPPPLRIARGPSPRTARRTRPGAIPAQAQSRYSKPT